MRHSDIVRNIRKLIETARHHDNPVARLAAIKVMAEVAHPSFVRTLERAARYDNDDKIRSAADEALAKVNQQLHTMWAGALQVQKSKRALRLLTNPDTAHLPL